MSKPTDSYDPINPDYYRNHPSGVECITVTEHMNFCIGSAIGYLWRAGQKGDPIQDLKKARWFIDREIKRLQVAMGDGGRNPTLAPVWTEKEPGPSMFQRDVEK